jgi:nucleoside-diphosphate-sugar epimerase
MYHRYPSCGDATMAERILVTGGTGYIAGELIEQLLALTKTVHTTVRNRAKSEPALRQRWPDAGDRLIIFQADLESDAGWQEAMAGCDAVAHVASPIPASAPKHEDDLIIPAREGTLRALRFAKAEGVARFVQTSSMAAIGYGMDRGEKTFNESHWTNPNHPDSYPYVKSKFYAEQAARQWVAEYGGDMEFVSVNPGMVLGPVHDADFSASVELIQQLLDGSMPLAPDLGFPIVDNRDVAALHVKCLETPGLKNERFLAAGPFMKAIDIALLLRTKLGEKARKAPTRKMPDWLVGVMGLSNAEVRGIKSELGKVRHADASHAKNLLGWSMRPVEDTLIDTANSLFEKGVIRS